MSLDTDNDQPDMRHYTAALLRNWPVPLITAVILALVFAGAGGGSTTQATGKVALVDESGIAVALGLPKEMGTRNSSPQALVALARGEDFRSAVAKTLGYSARVAVSAEDAPATVTVSATSGDAARAQAVVNANLDELVNRRRELRTNTITAALAANAARLTTIDQRLAALDQSLAKLDDPRSALAAGLLAEREKLLTDRTDVQSTTAGFDQLDKLSDGGVSRIAPSADVISTSKAKRAVYGLVFGALLGVAIVLAQAFFDRRLRTRRDVERIAGPGTLIAALGHSGEVDDALAFGAAIAAIDRGGASAVRLVPIGAKVDTAALIDEIRAALDGRLVLPTLVSIPSAAAAAVEGPAAGPAVLVAQAGVAAEDDLAIAIDRLQHAGVRVAGVALTGLKGRSVAGAVL